MADNCKSYTNGKNPRCVKVVAQLCDLFHWYLDFCGDHPNPRCVKAVLVLGSTRVRAWVVNMKSSLKARCNKNALQLNVGGAQTTKNCNEKRWRVSTWKANVIKTEKLKIHHKMQRVGSVLVQRWIVGFKCDKLGCICCPPLLARRGTVAQKQLDMT